jgi:superfamily II DNA or RNA helicase
VNVGPYILHPHQVRAVEGLRAAVASGKRRVILQAPCGFGKTIVTSAIVELAMERGNRVLFLASGRKLIHQKANKLRECDIPHAVLMSKEEYVAGHPCVVSSKDTLWSRSFVRTSVPLPSADILLIDECHLAKADSWQAIYKEFQNAVMIGVTATPALGNGKPLPGWDAMVSGGTYEELIAGKYLVPAKVYAPFSVDMTGVAVNRESGEYVLDQMAERYDDKILVGDFIRERQKYAPDLLTGFFAASVKSSIGAADEFNAQGIPAAHMDADTPDDERESIFAAARDGRLKVLCNFGVLRVGVDLPEMRCVQLAVSMNSLNTYLQSVGRGFRPYPGKAECVVIDHGGNVHKHGWPTEDHEWSLTDENTVQERDDEIRERDKKPREPLCCPECGAMRPSGPRCPNCGHQHKRTGIKVRTVDGVLKPMERTKIKKKKQQTDAQKVWLTCVSIAANRGMTFKQASWLFKQKTGDWPPDNVGPMPPFEKRGFKVRDLYPNWGRRKETA